jgi:hypothetical protein
MGQGIDISFLGYQLLLESGAGAGNCNWLPPEASVTQSWEQVGKGLASAGTSLCHQDTFFPESVDHTVTGVNLLFSDFKSLLREDRVKYFTKPAIQLLIKVSSGSKGKGQGQPAQSRHRFLLLRLDRLSRVVYNIYEYFSINCIKATFFIIAHRVPLVNP